MRSKKRILFVCTSLGGGGAERVVVTLLKHLNRERFQPCLVLFEHKVDYAVPEDVPIICFHKRSPLDLPKLIWQLSQMYKKWSPQVVLSVLSYPNIISVLAQILSSAKFKLLLCEHGVPTISSSNAKKQLTYLFNKWMYHRLYTRADKVICVSQAVANGIHRNFRIPVEKIRIINNPIDLKRISALTHEDIDHPWFSQKKVPIIISVGRLSRVKGYFYLLRAFAQVSATFPSRLVILGGEGDETQALKELTKELGIEDKVAFLGFQRNPFKYLACSDIAVYPSLREAFPMVVLEALSCEIPTISTHNPGAAEIITDSVNGLLVPIANELMLADAMLRLLTNRQFATKLARAGKERAEDFNMEKIEKEYEKLFA